MSSNPGPDQRAHVRLNKPILLLAHHIERSTLDPDLIPSLRQHISTLVSTTAVLPTPPPPQMQNSDQDLIDITETLPETHRSLHRATPLRNSPRRNFHMQPRPQMGRQKPVNGVVGRAQTGLT